MSDPACGLAFRDTAAGQRDDDAGLVSRRAWLLIWGLVLGLHLVLAVLWSHAARFRAAMVDTALEVVWVAVPPRLEQVVPPMPNAPARRQPASLSRATTLPAPVASPRASVDPPQTATVEPAASLFTPDGRVRIAQPETAPGKWTDADRISRDRIPRLPGATDAAAAEAVALRLRRAMTPEDVVMAVVRFLGGGARPDDCSKIEGRLYMSDPGVSREIDLNKFRRACTGIGIGEALRK